MTFILKNLNKLIFISFFFLNYFQWLCITKKEDNKQLLLDSSNLELKVVSFKTEAVELGISSDSVSLNEVQAVGSSADSSSLIGILLFLGVSVLYLTYCHSFFFSNSLNTLNNDCDIDLTNVSPTNIDPPINQTFACVNYKIDKITSRYNEDLGVVEYLVEGRVAAMICDTKGLPLTSGIDARYSNMYEKCAHLFNSPVIDNTALTNSEKLARLDNVLNNLSAAMHGRLPDGINTIVTNTRSEVQPLVSSEVVVQAGEFVSEHHDKITILHDFFKNLS